MCAHFSYSNAGLIKNGNCLLEKNCVKMLTIQVLCALKKKDWEYTKNEKSIQVLRKTQEILKETNKSGKGFNTGNVKSQFKDVVSAFRGIKINDNGKLPKGLTNYIYTWMEEIESIRVL